MPITFPFPVRVSVGLVVAGVEQLRKLPGDLPTLGVSAAGQAMRLSMRVQQEFAELAVRGDEVLSHIGGQPAEHPPWATFDEEEDVAVTGTGTTVMAVVDVVEDDEDLLTAATEVDRGTAEAGYAGDAAQELAEVIALDIVAAARSHDRVADVQTEDDQTEDDQTEDDPPSDADAPEDPEADQDVLIGTAEEVDVGLREDELDSSGADDPTWATADGSSINGAGDDPDEYDSLTLAELRGRLRRLSPDQVTELLGRERAGADRPAYVTLLTNRLTSLEQGHP